MWTGRSQQTYFITKAPGFASMLKGMNYEIKQRQIELKHKTGSNAIKINNPVYFPKRSHVSYPL